MRIAVLGLGYVGATTAACLAAAGHAVVGIDIDPAKVALLSAGRAPVVETGLDELVAAGVAAGRLRGASRLEPEAAPLDLAIVCVGTPPGPDGRLDLAHLVVCARDLGRFVRRRDRDGQLLLVFRSTMPPGTMEGVVVPALVDASGEPPGGGWEVAYHPEFLRESTAVADFLAPARIVVGERAPGLTHRLRGLHAGSPAPLFEVPLVMAELAKLVDNSWHAVKVAFANEVGRLAAGHGQDPDGVASLLLADARLNLGPAYLRPGGPYGGSCLPKDLAATLALAAEGGLTLPVMAAAGASNGLHLAWLARAVQARVPPPGPVLLVGLSFKAGTDDLRHSPLLALAELLLAAGYDLAVHDPDLDPARLLGANAAVAAGHPAVMDRLTPDLPAAAARARLIVLGKPVAGRLPEGVPVLDLAGLRGLV